jgi:hypothetical protein
LDFFGSSFDAPRFENRLRKSGPVRLTTMIVALVTVAIAVVQAFDHTGEKQIRMQLRNEGLK